jgi:hypothetical protein
VLEPLSGKLDPFHGHIGDIERTLKSDVPALTAQSVRPQDTVRPHAAPGHVLLFQRAMEDSESRERVFDRLGVSRRWFCSMQGT